jgi:hypothetical protein
LRIFEELTQRNAGGYTELHREKDEGEKRRGGEGESPNAKVGFEVMTWNI